MMDERKLLWIAKQMVDGGMMTFTPTVQVQHMHRQANENITHVSMYCLTIIFCNLTYCLLIEEI